MARIAPNAIIQTELFVGEPLKTFETFELKEFAAWMPKISSTTPPVSNANPIARFMFYSKPDMRPSHGVFTLARSSSSPVRFLDRYRALPQAVAH
jgi:hypothetical protein